MAAITEIRDLSAPELEVYTRLTEAQLRSREGLFIAESATVIGYALDAGCEPISFLMSRRQLSGAGCELMARRGDVPVYTADDEILAALTGYPLTRGILCALRRPAPRTAEDILPRARRVAVLEDLVDGTNLGAIFRSAAALGCDAVALTPSCADPLSRRACRVSMGTVFQIPWFRLGQSAEDWPDKGLALLRSLGFRTAALALRDDSVSPDVPALKQAEKLAIVLGTEGRGLRDETINRCDWRVKISMKNGVDSLNVGAAAAVAFWELCQ